MLDAAHNQTVRRPGGNGGRGGDLDPFGINQLARAWIAVSAIV